MLSSEIGRRHRRFRPYDDTRVEESRIVRLSVERCGKMRVGESRAYYEVSKKGMLVPGYDSDVIVFDKDFALRFVMVQGRMIKNVF